MATIPNKPTLQEKLAASKALPPVLEIPETVAPPTTPCPGTEKKEVISGYKSLRLKQFATKNGTMVKPNADGIFVPSTQEEYGMLEYYANQAIAYVERV